MPLYIRHIRNRNFDKALAVIRERIPFPLVCGHACAHPCESKCARIQYDEPVAIRLLKRAACENSGKDLKVEKEALPPSNKKVAIIGSGPCGLTAACYLAGQGHGVSVFEALPSPGGMLRYGIPEYRLPNEVVDREISAIKDRGVEITTNTPIDSPEKLLHKGFDVVLVTVGAWNSLEMGIEGEKSSGVTDGLSFLKEVNAGARHKICKRVVVVGGGNTAVDAARVSVRLGAEVILLYRRTRKEMTAGSEEIEEAIEEGVRISFLTAPLKVSDNKVVCIRMTPGPVDKTGRPTPVPIKGSQFTIECDAVIMAVGQSPNAGSLNLDGNINGTVQVDPVTLMTSQEAVFAAGDAVSGPSTIIEAIAQGRSASISIDKFLGGSGIIDRLAETENDPEFIDTAPMGTTRLNVKKIPLPERLSGFGLVELGCEKEAAVSEAHRCLSCDIPEFNVEVNYLVCKDCGYCKEVCTLGIFKSSDTFNPSGYKPVVTSSTERCVGCLKCLYVCPDFAIRLMEL